MVFVGALALAWWFSEVAEESEEEFSSSEAEPSSSGCPSWKVGFLCTFVAVPFTFALPLPFATGVSPSEAVDPNVWPAEVTVPVVLTLFLRGRWLLLSGVECTEYAFAFATFIQLALVCPFASPLSTSTAVTFASFASPSYK